MNVIFTTLSIGKPYTKDYCLKLINDVLTKTKHSICVTTDCKDIITSMYPNESRILINEVNREDLVIRINTDWGSGSSTDFNFNLKYLCFEQVKDLNDYLIIYTDCDNSLEWWNEEIVTTWVKSRIEIGYNFFAPRNSLKLIDFITEYKNQPNKEHGIFWAKLYNYDLINTPKEEWNNSPLPAEYLLLFYNENSKINKFYEQWKWFHDHLVQINKSYGTWAEGFEIGVSSLVSGFNAYDIGWNNEIWSRVIKVNGYKLRHPTET